MRLGQKEKWGVIMRKDCPLAEKEYITPKDLAGQPLIFAKRESVRNEIENWFGDCYDNIKIVASCDLIYNTESLVKGGVGLALCIDSDSTYVKYLYCISNYTFKAFLNVFYKRIDRR